MALQYKLPKYKLKEYVHSPNGRVRILFIDYIDRIHWYTTTDGVFKESELFVAK